MYIAFFENSFAFQQLVFVLHVVESLNKCDNLRLLQSAMGSYYELRQHSFFQCYKVRHGLLQIVIRTCNRFITMQNGTASHNKLQWS